MNADAVLFDDLPVADARSVLLSCCGSRLWAGRLLADPPFRAWSRLIERADYHLTELPWPDVLAAHSRIGGPAVGGQREAEWSRLEQFGMERSSTTAVRDLAAGNVEYERRFGHVFLISASGKSGGEMAAALRARLDNSPEAERAVVRAELATITRLRLVRVRDAADVTATMDRGAGA